MALDDLVYICTKLAREMDSNGVDKVFSAMEAAQAAIDDAKPLLRRAVELSDEVGGWGRAGGRGRRALRAGVNMRGGRAWHGLGGAVAARCRCSLSRSGPLA